MKLYDWQGFKNLLLENPNERFFFYKSSNEHLDFDLYYTRDNIIESYKNKISGVLEERYWYGDTILNLACVEKKFTYWNREYIDSKKEQHDRWYVLEKNEIQYLIKLLSTTEVNNESSRCD